MVNINGNRELRALSIDTEVLKITNLENLVKNLENENAYVDWSVSVLLKELKRSVKFAVEWREENMDPDTYDVALADIVRLTTMLSEEYRRSY